MKESEKLRALIEQIDTFINNNHITSANSDFKIWKTKAERFLIRKFGERSRELNDFLKTRFDLCYEGIVSQRDIDLAIATNSEVFRAGLIYTKAVFSEYYDEIVENEMSVSNQEEKENSIPRASKSAITEHEKKKYQVFVSSTYKDLINERAAVTQVLLDNDCIPVGMEQFPASGMSQMDYIRKMLDDCDYYILILAGKYGSLDLDGISFTEKEYIYAEEKGIPILSFVYKDLGKLSSEASEAEEDKRSRLLTFRERVCSNRLVKYYQSIGDLQSAVATSINLCKRDFPAIGWVRGTKIGLSEGYPTKWNVVEIAATTRIYANEHDRGTFTFDYSNNNGEFTIGKGERQFTTKWSKASDKSIHAYKDATNIEAIARIKAPCELAKELHGQFDFSSRCRTPNVGDIILWKNKNGKYAATKIMAISDDTRGADHDELTCEYVVYS